MKVNGMIGVGLPLLAGAVLLAGCACPVAEREIIGESISTSCPGIERTRIVRRLEPVGEFCMIRSRPANICPPGDRYYNPMTRSWERPWPFGPYDTANWR